MADPLGSRRFLRLVIDSVAEHIVVIDGEGRIVFVNRGWIDFGRGNGCGAEVDWRGVNYLEVCDRAAAMGEEFGTAAAAGIRTVMAGGADAFYLEYPCHSPDVKRWFMMRATPFAFEGVPYYVIAHQDITERRLAEEAALRSSRVDALTQVANRRWFDEFLAGEWGRCARLGMPVSLALIDIDHFKLLNDTYGHPAGDECLARIGAVLEGFARRPGDLCARYGGEEFALVLGGTASEAAGEIVEGLLEAIRALGIPNARSPTRPTVTVSVGLATLSPGPQQSQADLVGAADALLYAAKAGGRDRLAVAARPGSAA